MNYPNLREEKKLRKKGFKTVIGLDEAGRGPLAGPVVAAAVFVKNLEAARKELKGIRDSKKISFQKREEFCKKIVNSSNVKWGIGRVSEKVIDRINILEATKLAMKRALKILDCKLRVASCKKADFLVLDGNFKIGQNIPQKPIVKADEKVFSCAAASILAKVSRDKIMSNYEKKYPEYGFSRHKGYPTNFHYSMLRKHGPCKIHRNTFRLS